MQIFRFSPILQLWCQIRILKKGARFRCRPVEELCGVFSEKARTGDCERAGVCEKELSFFFFQGGF